MRLNLKIKRIKLIAIWKRESPRSVSLKKRKKLRKGRKNHYECTNLIKLPPFDNVHV